MNSLLDEYQVDGLWMKQNFIVSFFYSLRHMYNVDFSIGLLRFVDNIQFNYKYEWFQFDKFAKHPTM